MADPIIFTVRLTPNDWQKGVSAWICPAVDIPSVFLKEAYDPNGQSLPLDQFRIDKGPARVRWIGKGEAPSEVTLGLALGEKLSPASEERFWKGVALVVPIITALIGAWGGWLARAAPAATSSPVSVARNLYFRVDPNDLKDSGMPPAKITVNNQEINQAVPYRMESDATAIVDTTAAFRAFVNNKNVVTDTLTKIDALFPALNDLNAQVTGGLCSGGAHGIPASAAGDMGRKTTALSDALRGVRTELGGLTR